MRDALDCSPPDHDAYNEADVRFHRTIVQACDNDVLEQMAHIGVGSLPLVLIIGLFTGMVSAWQAAYQFQGMISFSLIGGAVSRAIFIELGPVLTAIVIAGRVGASIAAEIGTMRVDDMLSAIDRDEITDAKTVAALLLYARRVVQRAAE